MNPDPDVELLVSFAGTRTVSRDEVGSPDRLAAWLEHVGLGPVGADVSLDDVTRARHLRAGIISLLREAHGHPPDARTVQAIEEITQRASMRITVRGPSLSLEPDGRPVDQALASIVAAFYRCQLSGEARRVKACKACGSPFFDTSKNRSRIWCDMATCGSQEKARAYRQRKAAQK